MQLQNFQTVCSVIGMGFCDFNIEKFLTASQTGEDPAFLLPNKETHRAAWATARSIRSINILQVCNLSSPNIILVKDVENLILVILDRAVKMPLSTTTR